MINSISLLIESIKFEFYLIRLKLTITSKERFLTKNKIRYKNVEN